MKKKNLVISADDFGKNQVTNDNIFRLIKMGKLDRVSIMLNGSINPDETSKLLTSNVKLDIHLNLEKISPSRNTSTNLKEGILGRVFTFLFLYFTGKTDAGVAEISWEKQIEKFETLFGRKPDGINSHQHIHFFPAYMKIVIKLCKKYGISYLRFGKSCYKQHCHLICFILNTLRLRNFKNFVQANLKTSDFLISLDWIKNISKFQQKIPQKTVELVCHPERNKEFEIIKKYF